MSSKFTSSSRRTTGGIRYKLIEGPRIRSDETRTTATEVYLIQSSDVGNFLLESIPLPTEIDGTLQFPTRRTMPGAPMLVTKDVQFDPHSGEKPGDPFAADSGASTDTYDTNYKVTINYEVEFEGQDEDTGGSGTAPKPQKRDPNKPETFLERTLNVGGEVLAIGSANTKTAALDVNDKDKFGAVVSSPANKQETNRNRNNSNNLAFFIPTMEHSLRWQRVLRPNWSKILSLLGHVCDDRKYTIFFDAEPETVLFMGVSAKQQYVWTGGATKIEPWTLDFRFSQRHITDGDDGRVFGWNHVYDDEKGEWVKVFRANGDGRALYTSSNLLELFTNGDSKS